MKESQHIEWKRSWRDEFIKWICGFANADGGVLAIGKDDKGQVVGVSNAKKLGEDIPNKVRDLLGIMVDVNLKKSHGKDFIEISVDPYPYPISYKGVYHYRSGSTKQELKGAALDQFLLRKQGRHWDGVPVPHVSVDDLNPRTLNYFRNQALKSKRLSPEDLSELNQVLLEKLHLMENNYLTRAAVLLFHQEPNRFFTGTQVKIGFFESNTDLRYHDEIFGDLFSQVNNTMEVLHAKYMKGLISYEGLQRIETYPVPEIALREALLNAVIHKDYASGIPIQISVYHDKLMIWNPGQLPQNWKVEDLLGKHSSVPFNPSVAQTFFRAGKIEAWGRGIERIFEVCSAANIPKPEFKVEKTGLWAIFTFSQKQLRERGEKATQETTQETTQEKILALLAANPSMTRKKLAENIGLSPDGIKYHLDKMRAAGLIRHVGSTKSGHWEILK